MFIQGKNARNLALSGNIPLLKLLLIVMTNGLLKTFADSFISFSGILPILVDLLLLTFVTIKSCSTSHAKTFGRWLFPAVRFFSKLFSFIALILS